MGLTKLGCDDRSFSWLAEVPVSPNPSYGFRIIASPGPESVPRAQSILRQWDVG